MPEHDPFTATASPEAKAPKHRTPSETQEPDEKLNLIFVGVSERSFRAHAIEEANRRYNVATSGEGFIGVLKALKRGNFKEVPGKTAQALKQSIKGGIGREITLGNAFHAASREITDSQNLKIHEGGEAEDYEHALLYRFNEAADKYEDVIQEAAGEKRIKFNLAASPEDEEPISNAVKTDLRELLTNAVNGNFDNDDGAFNNKAFNEAVKDFEVRTAKDPDAAPYLNSSALRANNMYQMVLALRARLSTIEAANPHANDATINDLFNGVLDQTNVVFGEAHVGSYAETGRTMQERIADKLSRVPLLNPETVAIAAGALLTVGQIARRRTIIAAAAATGTAATGAIGDTRLLATMAAIGLTGAALGGLRGASAARQEHILRARRHARGEHDPLEGVGLYEGKTFTEATDELDILYDEHGELRQDNLNVTMQIYAQASARLRLSVEHQNGDLLIEDTSHPKGLKREDQFNRFVVACNKVKADLHKILNDAIDHQDTTALNALGIQEGMREELWDAEDPLEVILESLISGNKGVLEVDVLGEIRQDIAEKDLAQKKILRSSSFKGMATGAIMSLVGASLGQAIEAGTSEHITSFASGAYEKLYELFGGKGNTPTSQEAPIATNWTMNQNSNIEAPAGFKFVVGQNGSYTLDGPNGMHIEGLQMQANGALTNDSMRLLQEHEINTTTNFQTATETIPAQTVDANADNFIAAAENDKVQVYTDVNRNWIDNGTPGSDYNERLLGSPQLQPDGTITIDMGRLRVEPGSKLELSFTTTTPTGDKMLVLTPNSDGIVRIHPEDGSIYDNFQKLKGSNMKFSGKWEQAIIDRGIDADGHHNVDVLATDIGAKENTFTVDVPAHETQSVSAVNTLHYSVPTPPTIDQSQVGWAGLAMPTTARMRRGLNLPQTEPTANAPTPPSSPLPPRPPQPQRSQRFNSTPTNVTPKASQAEHVPTPAAAPNVAQPESPAQETQKNIQPNSEQRQRTSGKQVPTAAPAEPEPERQFPNKKQRGGKRRERAAEAAAATAASAAEPEAETPEAFMSTPETPPTEAVAAELREEAQPQASSTPATATTEQERNNTAGDTEEAAAPAATQAAKVGETPQPTAKTTATFFPADLASRLSSIRSATARNSPAPQNPPEQTATAETSAAEAAQAFTQEQSEGASMPSEPGMQPAPQTFTAAPISTNITTGTTTQPAAQATEVAEVSEPAAETATPPQPKIPGKELAFVVPEPSFGRPETTNAAATLTANKQTAAEELMQTKAPSQMEAEQAAKEAQRAQEVQRQTAERERREAEALTERGRRAEALINNKVAQAFQIIAPTLPPGETQAESTASLRMIQNAIQEVAAADPALTPAAIFNPRNSKQEVDRRLGLLHKQVRRVIHPNNFTGGVGPRSTRIIDNAHKWWTDPQNTAQNIKFVGQRRTPAQAGYNIGMNTGDLINRAFADLFRPPRH